MESLKGDAAIWWDLVCLCIFMLQILCFVTFERLRAVPPRYVPIGKKGAWLVGPKLSRSEAREVGGVSTRRAIGVTNLDVTCRDKSALVGSARNHNFRRR